MNKYCEGKMKRTSAGDLNVPEIVAVEAIGIVLLYVLLLGLHWMGLYVQNTINGVVDDDSRQ